MRCYKGRRRGWRPPVDCCCHLCSPPVCAPSKMTIQEQICKWVWIGWNYLLLYLLGAWYMLKELCQSHRAPSGITNQKGRVAVVTGGSRGIGLETVRQFLQLEMTVVIAGIMFWPWMVTEDGHEHHWAVNYLGHFLLSHLLAPHLVKSTSKDSPSRIVSLSSSVHYIGAINFSDIKNEKHYNPHKAYAQSKLAQLMFTITLNERMTKQGVLALAVHPGVVATELFQHVLWAKTFPKIASTFLKTPSQGSDTVVHVALSHELKEGGQYYENCCPTRPAAAALKSDDRNRLWDLTCHQLGIQEFGKA
ncbi:retinol dehydrogenase 12-like isoform X5 [Eriocheir sinensis]|uniref:retinol dehydrogenase 12-like isoform X5 n=1 Tax=Eriocheir sinensis TaxID=95602 RepID=UPI0021C9FA33|nr:retinol dehydrogenase 12-like isoform X5 [Eriocheir sinensis]